MNHKIILGLILPFAGTVIGALGVFLLKHSINIRLQKSLNGFAGGVMVAASVWSLLIPAMESSAERMGKLAFIPAVIGLWLGVCFLLLIDKITPHIYSINNSKNEKTKISKNAMLMLAVTLHNIPEGMAVGVALAGAMFDRGSITPAAALTLSMGIAIQNFPEGAIISMPLSASGLSKKRAFFMGVLSGAVEPVASVLTILLAGLVVPVLPYFLSFAAGAMLYVVVEELIPEISEPPHTAIGTIMFSLGFTLMMALDVALG